MTNNLDWLDEYEKQIGDYKAIFGKDCTWLPEFERKHYLLVDLARIAQEQHEFILSQYSKPPVIDKFNNLFENKVEKIIFLDIDGVINNEKSLRRARDIYGQVAITNHLGFCKFAVENVLKLAYNTDAKIVICSSWRDNQKETYEELAEVNIFPLDMVSSKVMRGPAILLWLEQHPEVKNWVVLDDEEGGYEGYMPQFHNNFVKVNRVVGFSLADLDNAFLILNQEKANV